MLDKTKQIAWAGNRLHCFVSKQSSIQLLSAWAFLEEKIMNDNFNTCDVCGKTSSEVVPGRWVFYCSDNPVCKQVDRDKTYDNEIAPDLESGNFDYILNEGLSDYIE